MKKLDISVANAGRLVIGLVVIAIGMQVNWSLLPSVWAQDEGRAGLVIQHGDGSVSTQCISFEGESTTGYDMLVASGLDLNVKVDSGVGTAICRIDNEGCDHQQDGQCFCQCTSVPCTYWNYWKLEGSDWVHSGFGASNSTVRNGDVDAWSWSTTAGDMADEPESKPPLKTFLEICEPEQFKSTQTAVAAAAETATAEASPVTNTPTPSYTPTPTQTPTPTETPIPAPVITVLTADREQITAGESVVLTWETSGADSVVLRKPDDSEQGVAISGSITLSPAETTTYILIARNKGGEDSIPITITVQPAEQQSPQPTVTPAGGDSPPETPTPTVQQAQPDSPQPTPTSTAIIISAPPSTSTPVQQPADSVIIISAPPNTPTDMPVVTPAPTPVPTDTPIPAPSTPVTSTPVATNTPTETVAENAIPDSSAPAESMPVESTEVIATTDTDATEVDSSASDPQLLTIFMGMIFVMAVPLILGMVWMGLRSFGGKRQ